MSEETVHPATQRPEAQDPENQPMPGGQGPESDPTLGDNQDTGTRRIYPSDPTGDDPTP